MIFLPNEPPTPNDTGEDLKGPQRQLWQEVIFVQYEKNKSISLLLDPIPIKCLPEVTKVLRSLNAPNIKECDCIDAWQLFARHFVTESYHIKVIDFDQS